MSEAAAVQSWSLPRVDGPVIGRTRRTEDLNALEREAWQAGFQAGREAGTAAALAEHAAAQALLDERARELGATLDLLARPLHELDAEVFRQVAALAATIAGQLVRRELKAQPDQIVAVVRETLALLPVASREVRVHLHPDDAALVRERLVEPAQERAWTIAEDPVLARGGCRITSEKSTIDARLEQRLGAMAAAVLGDERHSRGAAEA